ncbi:hypothetical protein [Lysobacter sp. Root916]|uniref:hypothetical protein n=1 Tax=Lysobacter sp. Root916 TaxID=1736606 RepID=UPI0012F7B5F0|nr:hypothetical protein [Lysobacter sp. Root916]
MRILWKRITLFGCCISLFQVVYCGGVDDDRDVVADTARAVPAASAEGGNSRENPIQRYVACFATVGLAAKAAGVSTEMLRQMRIRGFVSTRNRALRMAEACAGRVSAVELMALPRRAGRG